MKERIPNVAKKPCCNDYENAQKVQFGLRGEVLPLRSPIRHTNGALEARRAQQF